jgi:hypothetical protein
MSTRGSKQFALRGYRGSRGGQGRGRRQPASTTPENAPQTRPVDVPKPKGQIKRRNCRPSQTNEFLNPKTKALSNDPLYLEAFVIDGDQSYVEAAGKPDFTITTDSFISLNRRTYNTVCISDKEFGKHVSLSMYLYYNTLHFWARIADIRHHHGYASIEEQNLVRYISTPQYPVHEPIKAYLRGIGDFEDPTGTKHQFKELRLPSDVEHDGVTGFFGRVSAETHFLYRSLPAPGVVVYRILQDLRYTCHIINNPLWDLPEQLQPLDVLPPVHGDKEEEEELEDPAAVADEGAEEERGTPKRHEEIQVERPKPRAYLLGWAPAVHLLDGQRRILEECGLDMEFGTHHPRFALNNDLFEIIAARVRFSIPKFHSIYYNKR